MIMSHEDQSEYISLSVRSVRKKFYRFNSVVRFMSNKLFV